jgi:hypothetical protein
MGKYFNISQTQVRRILEKYNIPKRSPSESKITKPLQKKYEELSKRYSIEYLMKRNKVCKYCGKNFEVIGSGKKKNMYCSKECLSNSKKKFEIQLCKSCKKPIEILNLRTYRRTYCKQCNIERRKIKTRIKTNCANCNSEINAINSRYVSEKHLYCNTKCMALHYSQIYTGKNSPSWKGGKRKYQGNWIKAREKVMERDNFQCQICGKTELEIGKSVDVHHIKNYRLYKNKICANKPQNLISLCYKCHSFVHSKRNINKIYIKK